MISHRNCLFSKEKYVSHEQLWHPKDKKNGKTQRSNIKKKSCPVMTRKGNLPPSSWIKRIQTHQEAVRTIAILGSIERLQGAGWSYRLDRSSLSCLSVLLGSDDCHSLGGWSTDGGNSEHRMTVHTAKISTLLYLHLIWRERIVQIMLASNAEASHDLKHAESKRIVWEFT
jgi:hypothetical protein